MAIPAVAAAALKYGPAAYGLLKGLFGGKSKEEKARDAAMKRLQDISERGLDRGVLDRALSILNARNQAEQSGVLSRLAAGGLDPSSGLAQEAVGATRRSLGARRGEAAALFNEQSEAAKLRATEQLAGMSVPEDTSTGDLLGSLLTNLSQEKFLQPKAPAESMSLYDELVRSKPKSLEMNIRGSLTPPSQNPLIQNFDPFERARKMSLKPRMTIRSPKLIQTRY